MRVLLISTNKIRVPRPALPIGMAYISAALKAAGHQGEVLDLLWESRELKAVRERLTGSTYDVVGVAMDTVNQVESQLIMRHYDGFMKKTRIRGRRG